ncbi:hypothetical protein FACS189460_3530 [Deltaproteobacteria bacterium]|nr:hypothetical protein FACS189460_3530 [Deltaproteobacteria bacterium]
MRARFFPKRLKKSTAGALVGLGLALTLPSALWGQTDPAPAAGSAPSFEVLEVTTGSGSKSQDPDKPAMKIEMLDLTPKSPEAAAEAARAEAAADPKLTPAEREARVRAAALETALALWHSQSLAQYNYDIGLLQDPFMPIREVRGKVDVAGGEGDENMSLPPVLRLELNQLRLVAITIPSSARPGGGLASFEDGAGASYILRKGDRIGRRQGRITEVTASTVTVEEPPRAAGTPPRVTEIRLSVNSDTSGLTRLGGQVDETAPPAPMIYQVEAPAQETPAEPGTAAQ